MEIDEASRQIGVVGGEDLDGLKARMLLVAALGAGATPQAIQDYVNRRAGRVS